MLGRIPPAKSLQTVSVPVPTYMEKNKFEDLIESSNQNLSGCKFEVVVIDDDSPDGTVDVVRRLTKDYANTKLIVRSSKMGLGSAYKSRLGTKEIFSFAASIVSLRFRRVKVD